MNASVVVATYNNRKTLEKTLDSLLNQKFSGKYEVIVVNDGSTDGTKEFLDKYAEGKKILRVFHQNNSGVCAARNRGIENAKHEIVVNMDHDCIAKPDWLQSLLEGFKAPNKYVVSGYGEEGVFGGTSTAFYKKDFDAVSGYDEDYKYYREDTDLSFKINELHFPGDSEAKSFKIVRGAQGKYFHDHKEVKPKGIIQLSKYVLTRLKYHQNDVLLYKKNPTKLCEKFLHIKLGFIVDPMQDFRTATGTWEKGKKMNLSSPRGITFLENKTPLHTITIILGGMGYVLAVKASRLIGSLRFGKLLI